ncbi:MAG: phytanoyl-CoA dioxygenase family protein [Lentisphaeria bacterium]|nr:phytanoyl-CoA dioxygenase family protein [Lentisphaeria bacterium]NQZ66482.1 phytanoyl-CoA dioxygenase family protein [Lentisphaeria bacterium]
MNTDIPLKTALKFTEPIDNVNFGNNILELRTKGFTTVKDVFEPDSVDAYVQEMEKDLVDDGHGSLQLPVDSDHAIAPILAPRIRQVMALAVSKPPYICHPTYLNEYLSVFKETPDAAELDPHDGWHKDGRHYIEGPVEPYFELATITFFFRDMKEEADGATQVVVGSHVTNANPYHGDGRVVSVKPRKQDALLWFSKVWHRWMPRRKEGKRYFFLYRFAPPLIENEIPTELPGARGRLWEATDDPALKFYLGGLYHGPK